MATANESSSHTSTGTILVLIIVGAFILFALLAKPMADVTILSGFRGLLDSVFDADWFRTLRNISGFLVFGMAAFSFWMFLRIREMEMEHAEHVYPHEIEVAEIEALPSEEPKPILPRIKTAPPPQFEAITEREEKKPINEEYPGQEQWQIVLRYIASSNPSDWKVAIIQADTILDEITFMAGLKGETIGERLKNADPGLFQTLEYAREAHSIRNQIAHNFEYELSDREARRAIKLYEEVFKEFKYI